MLVVAVVGLNRWRNTAAEVATPGLTSPEPAGEVAAQPPDVETAFREPSEDGDIEDGDIDSQLPTEETRYTIQVNDTLWEISRRFYGHGSYFRVILDYNQIEDPRQLTPGQRNIVAAETGDKHVIYGWGYSEAGYR